MQQIEIRVRGQIDPAWSGWLGALSVMHAPNGETLLTGQVRDQSALYGLLERISSLGLQLVSVTVQAGRPGTAEEVRRDVKGA